MIKDFTIESFYFGSITANLEVTANNLGQKFFIARISPASVNAIFLPFQGRYLRKFEVSVNIDAPTGSSELSRASVDNQKCNHSLYDTTLLRFIANDEIINEQGIILPRTVTIDSQIYFDVNTEFAVPVGTYSLALNIAVNLHLYT